MKRITIKIIILSVVIGIFEMIELFLSPLFKNSVAMNQMSYSLESNLLMQIYDYISNYSWVIYLLLMILVFRKEILKIYKILKREKEKTNEQI